VNGKPAPRTVTLLPGVAHGLDNAIEQLFAALTDLVARRQSDRDMAPLSGKLPCAPLVRTVLDDRPRLVPPAPPLLPGQPLGPQLAIVKTRKPRKAPSPEAEARRLAALRAYHASRGHKVKDVVAA